MFDIKKALKSLDYVTDVLMVLSHQINQNPPDDGPYQGLANNAIEDLEELKKALSSPEFLGPLPPSKKKSPK